MIKRKIKDFFTNEPVARLILLSEVDIDWHDRLEYAWSFFKTAAPIVFFTNMFNIWISENELFVNLMTCILSANMLAGFIFHIVNKSFSVLQFLLKNALMLFSVYICYYCMDAIAVIAGDNIASAAYRSIIQIITMAYPISKIFKNVFILSNGNFPPKLVMYKLYDVMKHGDLKTFYDRDLSRIDKDVIQEVDSIIKNDKVKQN